MTYNFIDLFAGAGGLSEGFIRRGFTPVAHVEMDPNAVLTLKTRMVYHHLKKKKKITHYFKYLKGEITRDELYAKLPQDKDEVVINKEISDQSIDEIFAEIDKTLNNQERQTVDVLIGGPPCQAYSLVGRARDPYGKENDPRNYLYRQYVKFLEKYQPNVFVFENVPGILNAGKGILFNDIAKILDESGYKIKAKILNAVDFGVLQQRRRVILIGWKKGLQYGYPKFKPIEHNYLVNDLLKDLPPLNPGESDDRYSTDPTEYLLKSKLRSKDDVLTQHITRMHNNNDLEIYKIAIELWNKEKKRLNYADLPPRLRTHKNLEAFLDRFKVVGADLQHSHTMVAHIAKDGHYYIHPSDIQRRSLSVREAARIQSFPDNYFFEGSRTAAFTQIGNAVPPLMAENIAEKVLKLLENDVSLEFEEELEDTQQQVLF
ncbi:DNA (cytosine-5)-methyltransferase 1 [Paenibacillus sp. V4I3]|uniref:DNA cytosine methyltransferase n=1 Tax=Paenibacillus sp. V4I3 TaxID=3042305 RepID=UPI00278B8288|nr:DNA (cytosine-5-)-methyltransferase [Paenibacillus sp. V4I3]MDQ0878975.1 DNA (cytosine-5)-methyltransferase 1 [Paenibacillus sp. V4I3]